MSRHYVSCSSPRWDHSYWRCVSLAYAEIYKAIAGLVRRFDFELHDTTMEDMKVVGERVFAITRRGQTQVYVTIFDLSKM